MKRSGQVGQGLDAASSRNPAFPLRSRSARTDLARRCKCETPRGQRAKSTERRYSHAAIATLCSVKTKPGAAVTAQSHTQFDRDADLHVETATIMFADVVESVRLIEDNELSSVQSLRRLLTRLIDTAEMLHRARVLERRGDGLLLSFSDSMDAVRCASAFHRLSNEATDLDGRSVLPIRVGIHRADLWADNVSYFGKGINLAARLVAIAEPWQTVVSAAVKEDLLLGVQFAAEDMGECYLRHIDVPIHCYRIRDRDGQIVGQPSSIPVVSPLPKLAVIPFKSLQPDGGTLARVFTKLVNGALSKSSHVRVVSSFSMQSMTPERYDETTQTVVKADWLLRGTLKQSSEKVAIFWEITRATSGTIVAEETSEFSVSELFDAASEKLIELTTNILKRILNEGLRLTTSRPLENLPSNVLLLGAIALMHRGGESSDRDAGRLLSELMERHKRSAVPFAWGAKRSFLRIWRGWSRDSMQERILARQYAEQSVHKDAAVGLPFAVRAMLASHIDRQFEEARQWYDRAIEVEPSESLTWIFKASTHTMEDQGALAADCARRALDLSPFDPLGYYYKTLAGGAFLTNGEYRLAIELAEDARRENRFHHSTYRVLALAYGLNGQMQQGNETIQALLKIDPNFSVSHFLRNSPSRSATRYAEILRELGTPIN